MRLILFLLSIFVSLLHFDYAVRAEETATKFTPEQIEFFESKVRPILVNRCFKCHSKTSERLGAGLLLDAHASVLKGGDSGPAVIPGKPDESLVIQAVRYESNEMPPDEKLSETQIAALVKWVELGAPWPAETVRPHSEAKGYDWKKAAQHWAFLPIRKPATPATADGYRIHNPIDDFVVARLAAAGLNQPGPAAPAIFVRRAFIDLIGLPPSPKELAEWTHRKIDDATVAELIDSLLKRPQYGERWGRHWLDVARYSDVGGWTQDNKPHPQAWRYRDWVIAAFNQDMPYDEFVRRQIVGDKIADEARDRTAAVGTGFFALGPSYSSDGGDPESIAQAKGETLDDRVDTFSRAFLGLTVACARCHDHKFDPIPTQDYYSIAGIFNNTQEGETPLVDGEVIRQFHEAQKPINDLQNRMNELRRKPGREKRKITKEEQQQLKNWQEELNQLKAKAPPKYDFAHTIRDTGSAHMKVALRGNLLKPGEVAPRRFLQILAGQEREEFTEGSGRRKLADAVAAPNNPLTARVIVNRIWLNHFGSGLVRTPNNFGTLGEKPTHPDLLDWLAATFIDSGWSIKALHRTIMTSATYRSSSAFSEDGFNIDGDNRLLWRMNPRRMDVETWRDSLLSATAELDTTIGGPSLDNILSTNRRTLYAKVSRNDPLSSDRFLRMFNFPIPRASSAMRTANVIPQQFLFMMNSSFMLDRAKALAERLRTDDNTPAPLVETQIQRAYVGLYGRRPTDRELDVASEYLAAQSPTGSELNRWQQYCQVLLSANEFMYIR